MQAVVLAAGEGRRLRPLTDSKPKVMISVANRPILHHVVSALKRAGITDMIIVVGYRKERIMSYFESGGEMGLNIQYAFQEKQLGTAHGLLQAADMLEDEFIVVPGDNIVPSKGIEDLMAKEAPSVLATTSETPSKYGVVEMTGDLVRSIVEKPPVTESHVISTGAYHLTKDIFPTIQSCIEEGEFTITGVLNRMLDGGTSMGFATTTGWVDAVYPHDLLVMNDFLMDKMVLTGAKEFSNSFVGPDAFIGKGSEIHPGCIIEGKVLMGENCEIGPNVVIKGPTTLGDNVVVSAFTQVENCLIMDDCQVGTHGSLNRSVVSAGTVTGANVVLRARYEGEPDTPFPESIPGRRSDLGPVIGSDCLILDSTTIEPGLVIGNRCRISAGTVLRSDLQNESLVV